MVKSNRKWQKSLKEFEIMVEKGVCTIAQNAAAVLVQNVKFKTYSNIYKVITNILIEKSKKTHYS